MSIVLKEQTVASVVSPTSGKATLFVDQVDEKLKKKLSDGSVTTIEVPAGNVSSVFGRTGDVVSVAGDYDAAQVVNTPAGSITSLTVQDAINELDTDKLPLSHAGSGGSAHALVTTSVSGFMSPSDKTKLDGIESGANATVLSNSTPSPVGTASSGTATDVARIDHVHAHGNQAGGTLHSEATTLSPGFMPAADKAKLDGVASGATANQTDAYLLSRSNHTGTQTASTISDFTTAASAAAPVQSVAGKTGVVSLVKADVGLSNVNNTTDSSKPISGDVGGTLGASTIADAVITSKLLTGLSIPNFGSVSSADTLLTAIAKLATKGWFTPRTVTSDITVEDDYTLTRPDRTVFNNTSKVTLLGSGKMRFI